MGKHRLAFLALRWSLLWLCAACENTIVPTEVLVEVRSDLTIGEQLTRVDVEVYAGDGMGLMLHSASFSLATSGMLGHSLPLSFSVAPSTQNDARTFRVVVTGIGSLTPGAAAGPVVEKQVVAAFRPNSQIRLEVFLSQVCLGKLCRDPAGRRGDLTCNAAGECDTVPVEVGMPPTEDASTLDGQVDGGTGVPADTSVPVDTSVGMDGSPAEAGGDGALAQPGPDAGEGGTPLPTGDCDATRACSAGYVCVQEKCESKCTQAQCDPNATCSLMAGAAVCTCGSGFIEMRSGAGVVTCVRDVSCEQLGCDTNAMCVLNTDQTRACVCKPGYMGTGKSCAPVDCGPASLINGTATATNNVTTYGGTVTYACNAGYTRSGATTAMCGIDAKWSATAACTPVDCGAPALPNGMGTLSGGTTLGSSVTWTCNPGYNRGGATTGTCGTNRQWSPTATCSAVQCPALTAPSHGSFTRTNGNNFQSVATFSCDDGTLQGSQTRTCQASGLWSNTNPTCLYCGDGLHTSSQEQCDPTHPNFNKWNCTPNCTRTTAYLTCTVAADCTDGTICFVDLGVCTQACARHSECPAITNPPASPFCPIEANPTGYGLCVAGGCRTRDDCPPGLRCYVGSATSFCARCAASDTCL